MIPASIRNNNPGAMEPGFASKRFGSTTFETLKWTYEDTKTGKKTPKTNRCATFPSHQHGAAAMFVLLAEGKPYRNKTIEDVVTTWCGGYWASDYLEHMYKETGLKQTSELTPERVRDPDVAIPICQAIARWERGKGWPVDQLDWSQWKVAHDMAFGDATAPAPTPENDVPFQKPEGARRDQINAALSLAGKVTTTGAAGTAVAAPLVPGVPEHLLQTAGNLGAWSKFASGIDLRVMAVGALAFGLAWLVPWVRR